MRFDTLAHLTSSYGATGAPSFPLPGVLDVFGEHCGFLTTDNLLCMHTALQQLDSVMELLLSLLRHRILILLNHPNGYK